MLKTRLRRLLQLMPECETVADVGTDHAFLVREAVWTGKARAGIGTDVIPGPLRVAGEAIARSRVSGRISLRQGWGLAPLAPGEADVIVIAGMGGHTIREILAGGEDTARQARCLLLQPNGAVRGLRTWLLLHGFFLCHDDLMRERGHFYDVVAAAPDAEAAEDFIANLRARGILTGKDPLSVQAGRDQLGTLAGERLRNLGLTDLTPELWLEVGPFLLETKHPLLTGRVEGEISRLTEVLQQAERARAVERHHRRTLAAEERLRQMRKVREWLSESTR